MKRSALALLLLSLTAACQGEDESRAPAATRDPVPPLPECPGVEASPCDISERNCRARLMSLAACLRRSEPLDDLDVEFMRQDEYAALLAQDWGSVGEPNTDHFGRALSGLNLGPPGGESRADAIARVAEFVWAAFRPSEQRIVIVERGEPLDSAVVSALLVHEFVHALQDADYDLSGWPEPSPRDSDEYLAARSLVEGEAQFYQYRVGAPLLGLDASRVDFEALLQQQLERSLADTYQMPTYRGSSGSLLYALGAVQAFRAWQQDGPRAIDRLFASPPSSTWQVMAVALDSDRPSPSAVEIGEPATSLTPVLQNALGAWGLGLFLAANGLVQQSALALALGWRGDRLWLYSDESERFTYALWQIELATAEEAAKVDAACSGFSYRLAHGSAGARVFLSWGTEAQLQPPLSASHPELTEWGEAWLEEME